MGKSIQDSDQTHCPICYNKPSSWTRPKRCKHKYCYDCLAHWVKKGKKSCPLCRKGFNSVLKLKKRRISIPNGDTDQIESFSEINIAEIKKTEIPLLISNSIPQQFHLTLSYIVQHNYGVFVPWPMIFSVFDVYPIQQQIVPFLR